MNCWTIRPDDDIFCVRKENYGGIIMIGFVNTFLSYLILVVISMVVIVAAVLCGKKLREAKDAKEALKAEDVKTDKES
jgi:hypothetical protein